MEKNFGSWKNSRCWIEREIFFVVVVVMVAVAVALPTGVAVVARFPPDCGTSGENLAVFAGFSMMMIMLENCRGAGQ